jgi:hypothetical protein
VTVGDTLDTLTLTELRDCIRHAIGPPADELEHTTDVLIDETCRQWPERFMATLARRMGSETAGGLVLDAIPVIQARVREQIEARWGCNRNHQNAIDLILRAVVIEFANLWFTGPEARIAMRRIMFEVRHSPRP